MHMHTHRPPLDCPALDATSPIELALPCTVPTRTGELHARAPTLQVTAEASEAKLQMAEAQVSE